MKQPNATLKHVRIAMTSERYEVSASLLESVYGSPAGEKYVPPEYLPPEQEIALGILADEAEDGTESYFVKPADPAVLRAKRTGEETDAIERIDLYTEGIMTITPDRTCSETPSQTVSISYDESELSGMAGSRSTITYRTCDAGLVTMVRTGLITTTLTFRAHHRVICTFDTPYMPLQLGIHALVVDNRLDTDGELRLDYIIEVRGARAERCEMTVRITDDPNP